MNIANHHIDRRALVMILLFLGAILWLWFTFSNPTGQANIFVVARNTKTALALTADSLLGPFPTSTVPTGTASSTPTATPLISATPSFTPSITITPTSTLTVTAATVARTREPVLTQTAVTATRTPPVFRPTSTQTVPASTVVAPTSTSVPPTNVPTDPPQPTPIIPLPTIPLIETLLPFP